LNISAEYHQNLALFELCRFKVGSFLRQCTVVYSILVLVRRHLQTWGVPPLTNEFRLYTRSPPVNLLTLQHRRWRVLQLEVVSRTLHSLFFHAT